MISEPNRDDDPNSCRTPRTRTRSWIRVVGRISGFQDSFLGYLACPDTQNPKGRRHHSGQCTPIHSHGLPLIQIPSCYSTYIYRMPASHSPFISIHSEGIKTTRTCVPDIKQRTGHLLGITFTPPEKSRPEGARQ